MAKPANALPSVKITLTTTPQVRSYLEQLVRGGLYGKNTAEAAERLLTQALTTLVKDRVLQPVDG